ncbi:MAG: S41 family peptidase [Woeseiaceae bacterium]|nr:S41 family peptidase [Woeseiaceae bacterium]
MVRPLTAAAAATLAWILLNFVSPHAMAGSRADEVAEIEKNIYATHPEGRRLAEEEMLRAAAQDLAEIADQLSLAEYFMRLHQLFAIVGDGHTAVLSIGHESEPFQLRNPIRVQLFADGMYVTEARDEALPLLGGRVTSINDVPINEILEAYLSQAQGDNPAFAMRWSPFLFAFPGWLNGLGVVEGPYESPIKVAVFREPQTQVAVHLQPRTGANTGRTSVERVRMQVEVMADAAGTQNYVEVMGQGRILYIAIDRMMDLDLLSFDAFSEIVFEAMRDPDLDRLVIDLRRNGGGNNMLPERLRRSLIKSRFNRKGGIVVLIGPRTFSAAMNFATRMERDSYALFVGEPTGGRPNHFGDAKIFTGSATGIQYIVSSLRWQDSAPFDKRIWILPDVPAAQTYADFIAGRDPGLEIALKIQPEEIPDDLAEAAPWNRNSQTAGWRFFFDPAANGITGPATGIGLQDTSD